MKIEDSNIKFISYFNEVYGTILSKKKLLKRKYKRSKTLIRLLEKDVLLSIVIVFLLIIYDT